MAANSGTKLHGKNGAIWIATAAGGPRTKVAVKSEWTLNLSRDYVDATVFGDTNKTYLVGLRDVQGTYSGILDTSGDLLVNASASDTVYLYLYADDSTLIASGPAFVDANISSSNTDAVRTTGNYRAAGTWNSVSTPWTIFTGA